MRRAAGRALLAVFVMLPKMAWADTYPRQTGIDIVHYVFRLRFTEGSDEVSGDATITMKVTSPNVRDASLDLTSSANGKGMTVSKVTIASAAAQYAHQANRLRIPLPAAAPGTELPVNVVYHGIPAAGLRLGENIHGERTVFSENWPDKARNWLPMVDHPYDKATGEFLVTAPAYYQVVANGQLVEEVDLPGNERRTHWRQAVPIASWLYALGLARFAVHHYDVVRGIPQQVWSFPQDREKAYGLFEFTGRRAFEYFSDWIGPYSYEKLAHVEAAGLTGGTEHASAIFYGEKGVAEARGPVVHEVAHQWWGNSVTEKDWDDVWLSEGFATYFTHLYNEQFGGRDAFVRGLKNDVAVILREQGAMPDQPVIHRNISNMDGVLNRFVYQKAGWVLHMLRANVGTDTFWLGIRDYYRRYRNLSASTDDFRQVMEQVSGKDLAWFFDQWLKRPGIPKLAGTWRYDAAAKTIEVDIRQTQAGPPYRLPIEIGVTAGAANQIRVEPVELTTAQGHFKIASQTEPQAVVLDPNTWLLVESAVLVRQ
jgi:aminopeptidase N